MKIEHANQIQHAQANQKIGSKETQPAKDSRAKSDRLEISDAARTLHIKQQQVETTKISVAQQPEIRSERLEDVSKRIAEGYYNQPEVIEKITNSVIKSGVMNDAIQARNAVSTVLKTMDETPAVRQDQVDNARQRAEDGTYEQPEVMAKVAEEILKNMNEE